MIVRGRRTCLSCSALFLALASLAPLLAQPAPRNATPSEPTSYTFSNREVGSAGPNRFPLLSVAVSPSGDTLAVSGEEKVIKLFSPHTNQLKHQLQGHEDFVAQVAFSPDGQTLASAGFDGTVRLWDVASGKSLHVLEGHGTWVFTVAFSPDGKTLASGGYDRSIRLWNVATGKEAHRLDKHRGGVRSVAFSPDGKLLASTGSDKTIRVWDVLKREVTQTLRGHEDAVRSVAFSPESKWLVSGSEDGSVRLWDVSDGKQLGQQTGQFRSIRAVAYSPRGTSVVAVGINSQVQLFAGDTLLNRQTYNFNNEVVTSVCYSPDSSRVYYTSLDGTVRLGESYTSALSPVATFPAPGKQMWVAQFSPDGKWLLTSGANRTLQLRDARFGRQSGDLGAGIKNGLFSLPALRKFVGLDKAVFSVAVSPDGETLAAGCLDQTVKLYNLKDRKLKATLHGHKERIWTVAWSPDGKRLVSASGSWQTPSIIGEVKVWDVAAKKEVLALSGLSAAAQAVAWSPDGKTIATGCRDGMGRLHDATTGKPRATLKGHSIDVRNMTFSPRGRWLASSSSDGTVRIWETATGKQQTKLQATPTGANSVAWSPDGRWLAASSKPTSQSEPGEVRLWQVTFDEFGSPLFTEKPAIKAHTNNALTVAFSPDSKRLASGGGTYATFGEVLLYDVEAGRHIATLHGHRRWVKNVTFTKDGTTLISAGGTHDVGEIRLWHADPGKGWTVANAHNSEVNCAAWSADGTTIATGSFDRAIKVWDAATGKLKATLQGHEGSIRTIAFSPDGTMLASAGNDKVVKLWDLKTNKPLRDLSRHQIIVTSVAFSPDGKLLASSSADPLYKERNVGEVKVVEVATGTERTSVAGTGWANRPAMSVAFSPDSRFLVAGASGPRGLIVYDVQTTKQVRVVAGAVGVRTLTFSKDGRFLATAHAPGSPRGNGSIQVWDTRTWRESMALVGHRTMCLGIGFAPDGRTLASASNDATVKIWNLTGAAAPAMAGLTTPRK